MGARLDQEAQRGATMGRESGGIQGIEERVAIFNFDLWMWGDNKLLKAMMVHRQVICVGPDGEVGRRIVDLLTRRKQVRRVGSIPK